MKRRRQPQFKTKPQVIRYWGIHEEYGMCFGWNRSHLTPHLAIKSITPRHHAYCGFDSDRNRFIVRPLHDPGFYNMGWRKKAFR